MPRPHARARRGTRRKRASEMHIIQHRHRATMPSRNFSSRRATYRVSRTFTFLRRTQHIGPPPHTHTHARPTHDRRSVRRRSDTTTAFFSTSRANASRTASVAPTTCARANARRQRRRAPRQTGRTRARRHPKNHSPQAFNPLHPMATYRVGGRSEGPRAQPTHAQMNPARTHRDGAQGSMEVLSERHLHASQRRDDPARAGVGCGAARAPRGRTPVASPLRDGGQPNLTVAARRAARALQLRRPRLPPRACGQPVHGTPLRPPNTHTHTHTHTHIHTHTHTHTHTHHAQSPHTNTHTHTRARRTRFFAARLSSVASGTARSMSAERHASTRRRP